MEFLLWIENNPLGVYVREDAWGFAYMLAAHSVGMAFALGVVLIVGLRSLGVVSSVPLLSYSGMFGAAWIGFGINMLSGIALYTSHATEYTFQSVFILKLLLLALGGVFMKVLMNEVRAHGEGSKSKLWAGVTLGCWIGAIITGRLMAYF